MYKGFIESQEVFIIAWNFSENELFILWEKTLFFIFKSAKHK
jgi:hypothetical protein